MAMNAIAEPMTIAADFTVSLENGFFIVISLLND
jgi:hypothetical protein